MSVKLTAKEAYKISKSYSSMEEELNRILNNIKARALQGWTHYPISSSLNKEIEIELEKLGYKFKTIKPFSDENQHYHIIAWDET